MSGTSARESYRAGKRTRPSDSQPGRMSPPVLFRLPSVGMPAQESAAAASNMNSVAMAMPAAAMAMPASTASAPASVAVNAPSAPVQTGAATTAAEKAAGQRLLNMLIIVLLVAALAVIAWVSLNRPANPPTMADKHEGNSNALDTLGELKVPDVTSPAVTDASKPSGVGIDEIKPATPSDLALIDLPDAKQESTNDLSDPSQTGQPQAGQPGSLLLGMDSSAGTIASLGSTSSASATTAQIQLRAPVPMGNSTISSLVDTDRTSAQPNDLGKPTVGSTTTPRVETVSTPSQPSKVFPPNPNYNNSDGSASATNSNSTSAGANSGSSPSLWDEAKRPSLEGLQLSNKSPTSSPSTQVNISKPLSSEITMTGAASQNKPAQPSATDTAQATTDTSATEPGVTVGGGEPAPYRLAKSRLDLDPVMLARIAASDAAKSAVNGSKAAAASATQTPINSYAGATTTSTAGQNLYQNNFVKPTPGNTTPINSYASQTAVPPGVTGNGTAPYVPPTASTPNGAQYVNNPYPTTQSGTAQYPSSQYPGLQYGTPAQVASGPTATPAATAGYSVPARGTQLNYGQPTVTTGAYSQPGYNTNAQPMGGQSPTATQPVYVPSNYSQPNYSQPNYGQMSAPTGYGPSNSAYGPAAGSGYANPAYPSPAMNMPAGYQGSASYPTKSLMPNGQVPAGMIGPTGNATAPTSDIAPIPVNGRGGVGTSTPYGSPQ